MAIFGLFQGNPIERSPGVKVLVWANCAVLIVGGFFGFIGNIFNFLNLTYPVLAAYILLFGIIATAVEVGLNFATKSFGILTDWLGSAMYFIFVGTIGISFVSNSIIVLVCGIFSCIVGIACFVDHFACKTHSIGDTIRPV